MRYAMNAIVAAGRGHMNALSVIRHIGRMFGKQNEPVIDTNEAQQKLCEAFYSIDVLAITMVFEEYGIENYTFPRPAAAGPRNALYGRVEFATEKDLFLYNIRGGDYHFGKLVSAEFDNIWTSMGPEKRRALYQDLVEKVWR